MLIVGTQKGKTGATKDLEEPIIRILLVQKTVRRLESNCRGRKTINEIGGSEESMVPKL
jgi:hypothetical protein